MENAIEVIEIPFNADIEIDKFISNSYSLGVACLSQDQMDYGYGIIDIGYEKTSLALLDVNIHYLCTWKNIISMLEKNKILSNNEIEDLKFFLAKPEKWRQLNE